MEIAECERIRERKAEQQARIAAFERGNWFQVSLNLALRCSECGNVNEYQVRKIAVNPADSDGNLHLAQEFAGVSCGTWADFQFTSEAKLAVTAELVRLAADSDAGVFQLSYGWVFHRTRIWRYNPLPFYFQVA